MHIDASLSVVAFFESWKMGRQFRSKNVAKKYPAVTRRELEPFSSHTFDAQSTDCSDGKPQEICRRHGPDSNIFKNKTSLKTKKQKRV